MGIWIELGIFLLVFVFAYFQMRELKQERLKREQQKAAESKTQNASVDNENRPEKPLPIVRCLSKPWVEVPRAVC